MIELIENDHFAVGETLIQELPGCKRKNWDSVLRNCSQREIRPIQIDIDGPVVPPTIGPSSRNPGSALHTANFCQQLVIASAGQCRPLAARLVQAPHSRFNADGL